MEVKLVVLDRKLILWKVKRLLDKVDIFILHRVKLNFFIYPTQLHCVVSGNLRELDCLIYGANVLIYFQNS